MPLAEAQTALQGLDRTSGLGKRPATAGWHLAGAAARSDKLPSLAHGDASSISVLLVQIVFAHRSIGVSISFAFVIADYPRRWIPWGVD